MSRQDLYKDKLQLDYFSESYIKFEEDFYRYSAANTPLTFIIDDILLSMALSHKNYFKLNREKSVDGKEHYFQFKIVMEPDNKNIRMFQYVGQSTNGDSIELNFSSDYI
ncbi:MAG: DUF5960 family protein [Streptococcus sp.]|uniref:Uncharacterized protein n=1 Tax=Streptococcus gallolyticus TaxID=315405 RepID=A0A1I7GTZ2_9STRE|nr:MULTISPECIES: DUF5960 family protein [Streptococcus]MCR5053006.1 DUF5960 family protein [Streptococcus sp.]SFC43205.1 hypothetical protein SAMN02983012_1318 [Streptococcus gallolyticus]SFU51933.1 hypothetical protein SAMN05660328_102330 [Streptococcus gallolyticus]